MDNGYDELEWLWEVYLLMRAWGVPEYEGVRDEKSREAFADLVKAKQLFAYVEKCKDDVHRTCVDVPDLWLSPLCAASITEGAPLPQKDRDKLGAILAEIYVRMVRLRPNSQPTAPPAPVEQSPALELVTLDEAAAIVHLSKRALEHRLKVMPAPYRQGCGGKSSLWKWDDMRPWLEKEYLPDLPKRFPRNIR